ncbi:hypothetical protein M3Y97_00282400 [Aphelenchoides bicaudatus]|nr:hypothetical protein M3Y97_00282400 [Aphelenchoides bicaudatus]
MITHWIFGFFLPLALALNTPCVDQTQNCALVVEEFERQIQDVKSLAFRNCFSSRNACIQERLVFDDCYTKSLKAVRTAFNGNNAPHDEFFDAAERYRAQLEQCFHGPNEPTKPDSTSLLVDEDAIYARAIFGYEFSDRLWDLQEYGLEKPLLDPHDACLVKGSSTRVFGSGISRIVDSANPLINNLNNSCTLEADELTCYRHFLDQDTQFRQMLKNRDRAVRSCIQNIRAQRQCRTNQSSRIRSCICNAREEFESRLLRELLDCVKKSPLAQIYSTIINMSENDSGFRTYAAAPPRIKSNSGSTHSKESNDPTQTSSSDDPSNTAMSITHDLRRRLEWPMFMCLSRRNTSSFCQLGNFRQIREQVSLPSLGTPMINTQPAIDPVTLQQQRLQEEWAKKQQELQKQFQQKQNQLYQSQMYQQHPMSSATGLITGPSRSVEAGIGDGFERFFQGLPPIRRRDVSSSQRRTSKFK